ncbi:hypothetical protein OEA41_010313 [Lepraria neglecta]|uniref:Methyltransferase domain-containing protein n=1 Tax=Lepraria neglecta TaxID=209136 RepID=A0AAE0DDP2_9LECA|nr:hypothetical protein OEA41_010313 [Lepraria neglecta]
MPQPDITQYQPWSTTAPTYSSNVGRTSAFAAARLIELVHSKRPIIPDSLILDNGAGTGAVTLALASQFPTTCTIATDISASMLSSISAQQLPNVTTRVLDARTLTQELEKGSFTHVFNTFMLQTITTPLAALKEMYNVISPCGTMGIAIWAQRNGPFEIWERACQSIDPSYQLPAPFDDPEAWRTKEELQTALRQVGLQDVECEEISMPFEFESTKAYMDFWFGAKNPAAVKVMSDWKGSMDKVVKAVERVVRDEYDSGKKIFAWAVLGTGTR